VATGEEADEQPVDCLALPDDDLGHLRSDTVADGAQGFECVQVG